MRHRHIHAKNGEWIHIHRDNEDICGLVILIIAIVTLAAIFGC